MLQIFIVNNYMNKKITILAIGDISFTRDIRKFIIKRKNGYYNSNSEVEELFKKADQTTSEDMLPLL